MKLRIRYKILVFLLLPALIYSCEPDPEIVALEQYNFWLVNLSGSKMQAGETVEVTFSAQNRLNNYDNSVMVKFDVISGGGSMSEQTVTTDSTGYATVNWQMGNESSIQLLKASAYKTSGEYLSWTETSAYAFRDKEWNAIDIDPDGSISDMVTDTVNRVTFMISGGKLYKQRERYYMWENVTDDNIESPRTIHTDNSGIIYISTWNGEIVKSSDHGNTWEKCTKPYPEDPYYIYMSVSNDNYIWAGKWYNPTRFSKDGGATWIDADELSTYMNGNTFRLSDGTLVNHGTNDTTRYRFNISYDDGLTWISRETPGYSTDIYVTENDEIIICNQDNGFSFYLTTDLGQSFTRVHSVFPKWRTTTENNIFTRWKDFYYIIVPGYGILKSPDLINYETYWRNSDLLDLFIDHNGVLVAKDWNYNTVYYNNSAAD